MVLTLKIANRELELGTVTDLIYSHVSRVGVIDLSGARGAGRQGLGSQLMPIGINGTMTGDDRYEDFQQLERYRMLGLSLKLEHNQLRTVAFIDSVGPAEKWGTGFRYSVKLSESRFKQVNACDSLDYWTEFEGTLALEDSDPLPKEGYYCITDQADPADDPAPLLTLGDYLDLTYYDYVAFWIMVDNVADLTTFDVSLLDWDGNYALYNFAALLLEADTWYRIIIHKSEFTDFGGVDWSRIEKILFAPNYGTPGDHLIAIDDIGVYE